MKNGSPVNIEYIRRFAALILIALFAWLFFYSPSDLYEIKVLDFTRQYHTKVKEGILDPSETSLESYIAGEMTGPYHWSKRKRKVMAVTGRSEDFLSHLLKVYHGEVSDESINKHRSPNLFWYGNYYFFKKDDLPNGFLFKISQNDPDFLMIKDQNGTEVYFKLYKVKGSYMMENVPDSLAHPYRNYAYVLLLLAILIYIYLPRPKVPEGAASFTRVNAVYLPDMLGMSLWLAAWMFFFLPDDSAPVFVRYFLLSFFGLFALAIILPTIKYASSWYLLTDDLFQWSDGSGTGAVALKDIVSVKPYKKQLPKWVGPLMILLGRGDPVAAGAGMISMSASPEIGMEVTTKFGQKIKVMANYLEADDAFTERFRALEEKFKNHKKG